MAYKNRGISFAYPPEEKIKLLIKLYYFRLEKNYTITEMCKVFKISRVNFCQWMNLQCLPTTAKCCQIDMVTKDWEPTHIKDIYVDLDKRIEEYKLTQSEKRIKYNEYKILRKQKKNKSALVENATIQ